MTKSDNVALVVSDSRRVRAAGARALVSAGCAVTLERLTNGKVYQALERPSFILVMDADGEPDDVEAVLTRYCEANPAGIVLLLTSQLDDGRILNRVLRQDINHIIGACRGAMSATPRGINTNELISTTLKLISGDLFGLDKYLPAGVFVREHRLHNSGDREGALERVEAFLRDIDCTHKGVQSTILAVTDELLMNAMFSAPRGDSGKAKYQDLDRSKRLALQPEEAVELRYACDGEDILISVTDHFGSLERQHLMEHLGRGLLREDVGLHGGEGGAGIGLYMVIHAIGRLVFNIHPKQRTEVIASFQVGSGPQAFNAPSQSLHVFVAGS